MDSVLVELLTETAARGGSDLHLTAGIPPCVRVDGSLVRMDERPVLTPETAARLARSALTSGQRSQFDAGEDIDLAFAVPGVARFRCNVFRQRGSVAAVYRLIPEQIRPFEDLGLPPVLRTLAGLHSGLVLVTGPTGSGKSTTLAAMIDTINAAGGRHVLTIEDPIEFVHGHKRSIVNQREVRTDTASFGSALRAVLREDPDVVLIGEMRDAETVEAALRIAETGHLTLATLHTASAVQTVNRIVDVFPAAQQAQVRLQFSMVLEGLVCQVLVPPAAGRRTRARRRGGGDGGHAGRAQSDSAGQEPAVVHGHPDGGGVRHADDEPGLGGAAAQAPGQPGGGAGAFAEPA